MPPAVALVAAAAGAYVSASIAAIPAFLATGGLISSALAGSLAGAVVATGLNAVGSRALAKKPKAASFAADASGRALAFRSAADSHKIVYGRAKVAGQLVFVHTATDGAGGAGPANVNRFLHYVMPVACHPIDGYEAYYLNDQLVQTDANGYVTTAPYGKTTVTENAVSSDVLSSSYRNGIVTVQCKGPHPFAAGEHGTLYYAAIHYNSRASGPYQLAGVLGGQPKATFTVLATPTPSSFTFAHPGKAGNAVSGGTAGVVRRQTSFSSYVRITPHLGAGDQTADPSLAGEAAPLWTAAHRGRGIAHLAIRYEKNDDAFPFGPPNPSAVIRGKRVYDPRTGVTAWSDNAALCVNDYLTSRDGSAINQEYGFGIAQSRIHAASLIASANVCGEAVTKRDGTTQARYTCNGVLDTATGRSDNLSQLLTAMAGTVTEVQDGFRVHAAAYESPAGDVGIDDLAGEIEFLARPTRKDVFNAVRGVFVDPAKGWQPTDFTPVTNALYQAQDNGERLPKDIELPFTTDPEAAQRIAKVILEKGRQGVTVELPLKHSAVRFSVWDVVALTNPPLGWSAKPFRVTAWRQGGAADAVVLSLQEESAASYAWNAGEATAADPAPDTNLPNPFFVQPPGALQITEEKYVTRGVGVKARAVVEWEPSADVNTARYLLEFRRRGEFAWNPVAQESGTRQTVEDIAPGVYEFRVKAISTLGVSSEYSTATVSIVGLLDPPQEPQNLTISSIGGMAFLRWSPPADLDVREGGSVIFRHSPDETDAWHQSTTIGAPVPGLMTFAVLPLKAGVYLAKTVDSSGIESVDYASVTTAQATALAYANLDTLTEHPTFSGTKTDTVVSGGLLKLANAGLVSSIPLMSGVASLSTFGGIKPSGSYAFSGGIDLGSVKNVRVTGTVRAASANVYDLVSTRRTLVSAWRSVTGTTEASGDAILYTRATPDDPSGAPVWGDWHRLDSAEYETRAFEFRLDLTTDDPAFNTEVSQLSATVEETA